MEFRDLDVALGLPIGDFNDVGWSGGRCDWNGQG